VIDEQTEGEAGGAEAPARRLRQSLTNRSRRTPAGAASRRADHRHAPLGRRRVATMPVLVRGWSPPSSRTIAQHSNARSAVILAVIIARWRYVLGLISAPTSADRRLVAPAAMAGFTLLAALCEPATPVVAALGIGGAFVLRVEEVARSPGGSPSSGCWRSSRSSRTGSSRCDDRDRPLLLFTGCVGQVLQRTAAAE
jgi:hypothetical protein